MKAINTALMTAFVTSSLIAIPVAADGSVREQCETQVSESYRKVEEMKFISQRHFRDGTRIQYAISNHDPSTGYDTVRLAVCWLSDDDFRTASYRTDDALIADIDQSYGYNPNVPEVKFLSPDQ